MKVLVINCGSSSLKFRFIKTETEEVIVRGLCERIGTEGGHFKYIREGDEPYERDVYLPDHDMAVRIILEAITDKEHGVISDTGAINMPARPISLPR